MGQRATISKKTSDEAAILAVIDKFIEERRATLAQQREEERAGKEKDIWHKIRKTIFPKGDDEVLIYGSYTYRDPLVKVDKAYEERQEILALMDKFEKWYVKQPQKRGKREADYLKDFLAMQNKNEMMQNG